MNKILMIIIVCLAPIARGAEELPQRKEMITSQNLQEIHEKINAEIYNDVNRRRTNFADPANRFSGNLQENSLKLAYLVNISACGHNPSEAEHTWSLTKPASIALSNMQLCIMYVERLNNYDYHEIVESITSPNQPKDTRQPTIVFKSGISIKRSPAQEISRGIIKDLNINLQNVTPSELEKKGCCDLL